MSKPTDVELAVLSINKMANVLDQIREMIPEIDEDSDG